MLPFFNALKIIFVNNLFIKIIVLPLNKPIIKSYELQERKKKTQGRY